MKVTKNAVVSLTYELRSGSHDGDMVEKVEQGRPFVFLVGAGNLLPHFEQNLEGLSQGDPFSFSIESANAYGEVNPDAVIDLDKGIFVVNGEIASDLLTVGNSIPMQDQNGNMLEGTVLEIGDETVKMDFNHPLAGVDLHFQGQIIEVREATPDEISHGHVHGPEGHQH